MENIRSSALQQGKLEVAVRILHDIGNVISGINTKVATNQARPEWIEIPKLSQLSVLITNNKKEMDIVLGDGKGEMLLRFNDVIIQSLKDRENMFRDDFNVLARMLVDIEQILKVQRDFAKLGSLQVTRELLVVDVVEQAARLALDSSEAKSIKLKIDLQIGALIQVDETNFVRVLMQSIRTCVESIHRGNQLFGEIVISAVVVPGPVVLFKDAVVIRVVDTGAGLSADVQREMEVLNSNGIRSDLRNLSQQAYQIQSCQETLRSAGGALGYETSVDGRACIQTITLPCSVDLNATRMLFESSNTVSKV